MQKRPPVIVIMGHVDHGKTTLLDYIRKTTVAAREAGGITQSIGAYEAEWKGQRVTFIDTPGHEAFQNMRAYGAKVADIAVLVVAADDGVKPQTKEAIQTILTAKIPYIVAINKIDKNNADPERAKSELLQNGVLLEGRGGDVSFQEISAKTGEGVPELLDLVLLASDMEELQADLQAPAAGIIMTSRKDPRKGILVGVVIKNGTLRSGDAIRTATASGKVRSIETVSGEKTEALAPCAPALIIGFESLPQVGEEFTNDPDLQIAADNSRMATDMAAADVKAMPIVIKADETASLEALKGLIVKAAGTMPVRIVDASVGNITENDVKTADASGALVIGFRTKVDKAAENLAQGKHVTVITSEIIYELEKAVTAHLNGVNPAERRRIEILAVFGELKGQERVVGGRVVLGPVKNQEAFEVWEGDASVGEGKILNLQSQKKDITEAKEGMEVGLLVQSAAEIKQGSTLIFK
jgi:translation initiation factor IF-2